MMRFTKHDSMFLFLFCASTALCQTSSLRIINEPEFGSAAYLEARDLVPEHRPKTLDVVRERLVKINFQALAASLNAAKESRGLLNAFEIHFFKDVLCTYTQARVEDMAAGWYLLNTSCDEYYGHNRLMFSVWPDEKRFVAVFRIAGREYWLHLIEGDYAVVFQIDPRSRNRDKPLD